MDKAQKIMGVIGGMGPLATQLFYKMVIEGTDAHRDQEHIDMVILSHATMTDRTEAIQTGKTDRLLAELADDAELLETAGACCIAIPCNTSHVIIDQLQARTSLPIINMIRAAVRRAENLYGAGARVGIMATDGTIQTGLYQRECERQGLEPVRLSAESQRLVMKLIYEGVKQGEPIDYDDFETVEREFRDQECDCVIMACTELSCLKEQYQLSDYFVDAMAAMAAEAIVFCGKTLRQKDRQD